jgi:hypothetical protein
MVLAAHAAVNEAADQLVRALRQLRQAAPMGGVRAADAAVQTALVAAYEADVRVRLVIEQMGRR